MKQVVMVLALVAGISSQAFAAPASCGQLIERKAKVAAQLAYLQEKMNSSINQDVLDLYQDQYEALQADYQTLAAKIENNCK